MNMNSGMMDAHMMGGAPERKPCRHILIILSTSSPSYLLIFYFVFVERYFSNGACRFGDNCNFSHDVARKLSTVCRYFLMGNCSYGDRCFYEHSTQMQARPNEHHPPQVNMVPAQQQHQEMETN